MALISPDVVDAVVREVEGAKGGGGVHLAEVRDLVVGQVEILLRRLTFSWQYEKGEQKLSELNEKIEEIEVKRAGMNFQWFINFEGFFDETRKVFHQLLQASEVVDLVDLVVGRVQAGQGGQAGHQAAQGGQPAIVGWGEAGRGWPRPVWGELEVLERVEVGEDIVLQPPGGEIVVGEAQSEMIIMSHDSWRWDTW